MFCREREILVFHRRAQPSERGNNPFMYFSCSLTTPVGVLFVLSSSVCLIFPLLSLFGVPPALYSANPRLFLFVSSQIIAHNSRDPCLSCVFVICGFVSVSCLKAKKEGKRQEVVRRSDWQGRKLAMLFSLSFFSLIETQPLLKKKYENARVFFEISPNVCLFVCFRTESVAEKMLTNWFAFLLHKFLKVTCFFDFLCKYVSCRQTSCTQHEVWFTLQLIRAQSRPIRQEAAVMSWSTRVCMFVGAHSNNWRLCKQSYEKYQRYLCDFMARL